MLTPGVHAEAPAESSGEARAALSRGFAALLRADGAAALPILLGIPDAELAESSRRTRDCIVERLQNDPETIAGLPTHDDPLLASVTTAYRRFWRRAAMNPDRREAAQDALVAELGGILGTKQTDTAKLGELARTRIGKRGASAITGRTGYLLDLIMWRSDEVRNEIAVLPEGLQPARVHYLDDFVSRGWSNYLSCDRSGTGGWANEDGLFVIVPAYDSLTDEAFRISYLVHESQHLADYGRFPGLEGWQLEYRAKLAELVYAVESRESLLARFASNVGVDSADAHSYANGLVLAELRERLGLVADAPFASVPVPDLQYAAKKALWADSASREAAIKAEESVEGPTA